MSENRVALDTRKWHALEHAAIANVEELIHAAVNSLDVRKKRASERLPAHVVLPRPMVDKLIDEAVGAAFVPSNYRERILLGWSNRGWLLKATETRYYFCAESLGVDVPPRW